MGKSRGKKRKANEAAIATSIQGVDLPPGWMQQLLVPGPDLAYVLAALANAGNISVSQIKKARKGLPSFSAAKWTEVAPQFGLSDDLTTAKFDPYLITPVLLPPSFHETIAEAAWRIQDVYQERISQEREEVRVRAFDAVCPTVEECFRVLMLHQVDEVIGERRRDKGVTCPTAVTVGE
jgi:hypothetical protein